jgi:hypothetical protein
MTIKHYTKNRQLIMQLLSETWDDCGLPPYSADSLHYILDIVVHYCPEYGISKTPSKSQIHRTLRDLVKAGLLAVSQHKEETHNSNKLPRWVRRYQPVAHIERNQLLADVSAICNKVRRAKYGISFFGSTPFDYGALPDEVAIMKTTLKSLMQKTHPDKAEGYTELFKQLKDCMSLIRSGIPLPTDPAPEV